MCQLSFMIHQRKIEEQRRVDASLAWLFLFAYELYGGGVYKSWVQAPCPLISDRGEMQAVGICFGWKISQKHG